MRGTKQEQVSYGFLAWRFLVGKEESITVSFMVVGHTCCAVDGGFGLAKKKFRASDTDTSDQLASLVSASAAPNESCKASDWVWLDWHSFLQGHFKKIAGIMKHHHFSFSVEEKGVVTMKGTCREKEPSVKVRILKDTSDEHTFSAEALPPVLPPGGMSAARREYLENVLEFCRPENRDAFKELLH